ncbi:MAG: glycerophosphodiester phosphodiesterase [Ilumatobacteraceae bacterium]|jgi:glycerophosphoryl diester phosphodiesterase|nr:glycerophosphodiester phosphodiesterase [Ilumatobacteraceae bacterium]
MPATHPFLDWDGPIPFAHRGGAGEEPENTLPAFARAVAMGYVYLETDVHATADGVLVAFHDPDLSRTCGRPGRIDELPWSEVAAARVHDREPIPLLEDLLSAFPDARINIDCKADSAVDALVAAIRRTGCIDRVCVGGFSDRRLRRLRAELGPALCTSYGPGQVAALRAWGRAPGGGLAAQVPVRQGRVTIVERRFLRAAHARGVQVHVWTIDDAAEMDRLLDLGVDGIMTDRPAVLREVLERRGAWHS